MNRHDLGYRIEAGPNYRASTDVEQGALSTDGSSVPDGGMAADSRRWLGAAILLSAAMYTPEAPAEQPTSPLEVQQISIPATETK